MGALVLGSVARGVGLRADAQRAADLAALAGARAMLAAYPRLFEAPASAGAAWSGALPRARYLADARRAARRVARLNGAPAARVSFPEAGSFAPVRIRVAIERLVRVRRGAAAAAVEVAVVAEAELVPDAAAAAGPVGGYDGPLAHRQGKPMRPDVATAFDRLAAAARADGHALVITSAFRSDAEQAALWARRPDPRWVAPPGRSLHRNGTELDLGPPSAYAWLAARARRFGFVRRYAWEPWHYGYSFNARSAPPAVARAEPGPARPRARTAAGNDLSAGAVTPDGRSAAVPPSFVPARFQRPIARAAQRWSVSAALLAAQIYAESNFNPFATSPVGARGIAQFMPATASAYGLGNPYDADSAIDAQARMMRDLLREFAAVPLALAAYNAGPARVRACMCVPPIAETRGYVARILGLMGGAGEPAAGSGLRVRLVR